MSERRVVRGTNIFRLMTCVAGSASPALVSKLHELSHFRRHGVRVLEVLEIEMTLLIDRSTLGDLSTKEMVN